MKKLVGSCEEIGLLVSLSMDEKISYSQRLAIRFHLLICYSCRIYQRQLAFIRKITRSQTSPGDKMGSEDNRQLSSEMAAKIKQAIKDKTA